MSLSWFKIYGDLPEHPKSDLLEIELQTPRAWTFVVQLWCWASRVLPDGDLSRVPAEIVARRAGWNGDAQLFVRALQSVGFLDGLVLHDWEAEQGAFLRKRERDRERAQAVRETKKKRQEAKVAKAKTPQQEAVESESQKVAATSQRLRNDIAATSERSRGVEEKRREEKRVEENRKEEREFRNPERAREENEISDQSVGTPQPQPAASLAPPNDRPTPLPNRQRGVMGLAERADRPASPAEMAEKGGDALLARFPAYDGKSGRPTIKERLEALWSNYIDNYNTNGPEVARAKLLGWLGDANYQRLLHAYERERASQPGGGGQHPRWAEWRRLKDDPSNDLPPFQEWLTKQEESGGRRRNGSGAPQAVGLFVPKAFDYAAAAEGLAAMKSQPAGIMAKSGEHTAAGVPDAAE